MQICRKGHEQRGPQDTLPDGQCRRCDRERQVAYRSRRQAAAELAQALEANGIPVTRSTPMVDLQQLAADLSEAYRLFKPPTFNLS